MPVLIPFGQSTPKTLPLKGSARWKAAASGEFAPLGTPGPFPLLIRLIAAFL